MSFEQLQSLIPGAVSRYGRSIPQVVQRTIVYSGQSIPRFLQVNGGNPNAIQEFLRLNQIGDPFKLEEGRIVQIPQTKANFARHPEA